MTPENPGSQNHFYTGGSQKSLFPAHSAFAQEMKPHLNNLFGVFPLRSHTKPGHLRRNRTLPESWSFSLMLFALSLFPILREENVSLPVAKDKDPRIITISSCHTHSHQSQQRILLAPSSKCTQRVATFSIYRWPLAQKSRLPPRFQQETLNWSLCFFPSPLQAIFGLGAKGYSKMRGSLCWLHFY